MTQSREPSGRLKATFEVARGFGPSDEEVWEAAKEVASSVHHDKPADGSIEQVADALARRIEGRGRSDGGR
jgi:hypothetical protein